MLARMTWTSRALLFFSLLALGCGGDDGGGDRDAGDDDSGIRIDGGPPPDSGPPDAMPGEDAEPPPPVDAGPPADAGPRPDWAACTLTSQCTLAANTCCGPCGAPELTDLDGVNMSRLDDHRMEVCPDPDPICPGCPTALNPYLIVTCDAMRCEPVDTRREDFTTCSADTDCRVRVRECCECGGTTDPFALIAIRSDAEPAYAAVACDPGTGCPECAPVYPAEARAVCRMGHCEVAIAGP